MHYITALHPVGNTITLRTNMTLPGLTVPSNVMAVALSGAQPFLAVAQYGQGRAVQWSSYAWMPTAVLGPLDGLDDLVWRSLVWAARKPFVIRGLPNLLTLRMDDCTGPFWWVHIANGMGFKPWLSLFLNYVSETNTPDLCNLVTNGNATTSIHSLDCCDTFFFFNHSSSPPAPWSDTVMSNYFYTATQWHASHGIPISKVVVPHYSEIGSNAFGGLQAWDVQFVGVGFSPDYYWYYTPFPPWLIAGPYRLYETPRDATSTAYPAAYADFLTVPGHPEFDGQFFCCYTEISENADNGDWSPNNNDVAGSIARGTSQVKSAFNSMVMGALYAHEWELIPIPLSSNQILMTSNNWYTILQAITNNLAAYNPMYVTFDYAAQYVRATRTSRLTAADYDPLSGRVTITLSGSTDLAIQTFVFVGQDNSISSISATVPAFSGGTTNLAAMLLPPSLAVALTPTNTIVLSWPNPTPGYVLEQTTALGAANWTTVTNSPEVVGDTLQVVLATLASGQFYRLVQP
jgi:hypothetical protein